MHGSARAVVSATTVPARFRWIGGLVLACVASAALAQAPPESTQPDAEPRTLATEEGPRSYLVTVPASATESDEPPSLVVVLHANGGTGARVAATTRFDEEAERHGFVVAYPSAVNGTWNYVRGIPGYPEAPDDTAFLRALVEHLRAELGTDPGRTYAVGYSNGGFMAQRLLCEAPDVFAGAVSVAAAGFAGMEEICETGPPRSLALIHGTADRNVPWDGLPVEVPGGTVLITWPVPTTFAWWAERAGCEPSPVRTERPRDVELRVASITLLELRNCTGGHRVALMALVGGGHGWPRGATFDAAREAWRFLQPISLD